MKRLNVLVALAALFMCISGVTQAFAGEPEAAKTEIIWESEKKLDYSVWVGQGFQEFRKLDDNIYIFRHSIHRTLAVVADEGVLVFDVFKPAAAKQFLKCIRMVTDKPIKYMIHSHNHNDHAKGGEVMREAGAKIVSHIDTKKWFETHPHPEVALPDFTWGTGEVFETWDFNFGGVEIKSIFVGPSHGTGMTAFYFPQKKLMHTIDIQSPGRVPPGLMPDFTPRGEIAALRNLLTYDFDKVISAHEPTVVAARSSVSDAALYYEIMTKNAKAAIAKVGDDGSPWHYMQAVEPPGVTDARFATWRKYDKWWKGNMVRAIIEERLGM